MSISENVGALNNHLAQLLTGNFYTSIREGGKKVLSDVPPIKELVRTNRRTSKKAWWFLAPCSEELGFNYIGPIDRHDVKELVKH